MPDPLNIFEDIPPTLPEELIDVLAATGPLRIERIVSMGHASPEGFWYDQESDEWVLLVRGSGLFAVRAGMTAARHSLEAGRLPATSRAHRRHKVEWILIRSSRRFVSWRCIASLQ